MPMNLAPLMDDEEPDTDRRATIPFHRPALSTREYEAVVTALRSGWLTTGPRVREFEIKLSERLAVPHVVCVDSCTSALTLSLRAIAASLGADPRDVTVAVPALTFVASANAVLAAGMRITFVDVDAQGLMDPGKVGDADILMPVHFGGMTCDMEALWALKRIVVEDAAHAIGGVYRRHVTPIGGDPRSRAVCFSFYPTKPITTIEGGAVATHDEALADHVGRLSLHGLGSGHIDRYQRSSTRAPVVDLEPGVKANMTDVGAALGIVQLDRIDALMAQRRYLARRYVAEFRDRIDPLHDVYTRHHVWHLFIVLCEARARVAQALRDAHIGFGMHYTPPIPLHPYYRRLGGYGPGDFPMAERIASRCLSLPLWPALSERALLRVVEAVTAGVASEDTPHEGL